MKYRFMAKYVDGSVIVHKITTSKHETYRDAWIYEARIASEYGKIKEMVLIEKEDVSC